MVIPAGYPARAHHGAAALPSGRLAVFGGRSTGGARSFLNDVWIAPGVAGLWAGGGAAAWEPRFKFSAAVSGGRLFLYGGANCDASSQVCGAGSVFGDAWSSADAVAWSAWAPVPGPPRFGAGMLLSASAMFLVGGSYLDGAGSVVAGAAGLKCTPAGCAALSGWPAVTSGAALGGALGATAAYVGGVGADGAASVVTYTWVSGALASGAWRATSTQGDVEYGETGAVGVVPGGGGAIVGITGSGSSTSKGVLVAQASRSAAPAVLDTVSTGGDFAYVGATPDAPLGAFSGGRASGSTGSVVVLLPQGASVRALVSTSVTPPSRSAVLFQPSRVRGRCAVRERLLRVRRPAHWGGLLPAPVYARLPGARCVRGGWGGDGVRLCRAIRCI